MSRNLQVISCNYCGRRSRTPASHKDNPGHVRSHWFKHHMRTRHPSDYEKEFPKRLQFGKRRD